MQCLDSKQVYDDAQRQVLGSKAVTPTEPIRKVLLLLLFHQNHHLSLKVVLFTSNHHCEQI